MAEAWQGGSLEGDSQKANIPVRVILILLVIALILFFVYKGSKMNVTTGRSPGTTTIQKSQELCNGLTGGALDACYYREAMQSINISLCGLIREGHMVKSPMGRIDLREDCFTKINNLGSNASGSNTQDAKNPCSDLKGRLLDACLYKEAIYSADINLCEKISERSTVNGPKGVIHLRKNCLDKLSNPDYKPPQTTTIDPNNPCTGLTGKSFDICTYKQALNTQDASLCNMINPGTTLDNPKGKVNLRDYCNKQVNTPGQILNKTEITEIYASNKLEECMKLSNPRYKTLKDNCIFKTSRFIENSSSCELITDSQIKTRCLEALQ